MRGIRSPISTARKFSRNVCMTLRHMPQGGEYFSLHHPNLATPRKWVMKSLRLATRFIDVKRKLTTVVSDGQARPRKPSRVLQNADSSWRYVRPPGCAYSVWQGRRAGAREKSC